MSVVLILVYPPIMHQITGGFRVTKCSATIFTKSQSVTGAFFQPTISVVLLAGFDGVGQPQSR